VIYAVSNNKDDSGHVVSHSTRLDKWHITILIAVTLLPLTTNWPTDLQQSQPHLAALVPDPAQASRRKLNETAELIIRGKINKIESSLANGTVQSRAEVIVHAVEKGPHVSKIIVEYEGGEVGDIGVTLSNQPRFKVEEHVRLYLVRGRGDTYTVVDGPAGKVELDPESQAEKQAGSGYSYSGLHWPSNKIPVSYYVNTAGGPTSPLAAVQAGFQAWNDAGAAFSFAYLGTTTRQSADNVDGYTVVCWQYVDGPGRTLAVAWIWYYPSTNEIVECDIRYDSADAWATDGSSDKFDVQGIAAHESGHWLCLDDLYDTQYSEMTMYGYASPGETKKRTLEWGDIAGIRYIYGTGVQITVTSSPLGSGFITVDGSAITTPRIFAWTIGSTHTLAANSPVSGGTGIQYVWLSWSDEGAQSHTITVPSSPNTYTANFKKQYMLTVNPVSPTGAGTLSVSSGWRDEGTTVSITATVNTGYSFYYWSLDEVNVGSSFSYSVVMNSPHSLTAYFRSTSSLSVGLSAGSIALGASVTLSGTITPTQPSPGIPTGTTVTLSYSLDGATWNTFITTKTSSGGAYSIVWYPPYPNAYQIKASWSGDSSYEGSTSSVASLTVTGTFPPRITLLVSGPSSSVIGSSVTFDVMVNNPGSLLSTTLYVEVTGPGGYWYFDTQQITVAASGRGIFQFIWQVPSTASTGQYQIFVGLIPPKPTAIAQTQIIVLQS
jgi:hypothetical protein